MAAGMQELVNVLGKPTPEVVGASHDGHPWRVLHRPMYFQHVVKVSGAALQRQQTLFFLFIYDPFPECQVNK